MFTEYFHRLLTFPGYYYPAKYLNLTCFISRNIQCKYIQILQFSLTPNIQLLHLEGWLSLFL